MSSIDDKQTAAIEISGVTKRFGEVVAVRDMHLTIADGEFFALLGPSGCGKTTTLRMIAGLELPTEGSLKIFGDEVGLLPPNKRPVNTVFQNYALFPHMNVLDNVTFGLRMSGVPKKEAIAPAMEAIAMVRLEGLDQRRPDQLSGGQQQRVALARALVNKPKVLLLDEPLGALDLKLRQEMQRELKTIQRELGVSFVFVTHDQEEALTMSDRIAVMSGGDVLQIGDPKEIYERPANRFVADFIGQTNLIEATALDHDTVMLANGMKLWSPSSHPAGERVALSLRPEALRIGRRGSLPGEQIETTLDGVVQSVTYLGNSLVYRVSVGWTELEVRTEPSGHDERLTAADEVTVWWDPRANWVVAA